MAKIEPMDLVKSLSGKLCGHSDISKTFVTYY